MRHDVERAAMNSTKSDPLTSVASDSECLVCGQSSWLTWHDILLQCGTCGHLRAGFDVDEETALSCYGSEYFHGGEYGDYLAEREVLRRNFARRFEDIDRITGGLDSVFEIGCAYGFWLELSSSRDVRAAGVDVCLDSVSYARDELGQDAVHGDFSDVAISPGQYDAFVMWDTIEHLAQPERFVARVAELLPPGGWLFLTTGDAGSRLALKRGPKWRLIHPPTHVHYFNRDTMERFLARHGLEVRSVYSAPIYRNMRGTLANLQTLGRGWIRKTAAAIAPLIPTAVQDRIGLWINLGDIMFVAAQKTGGATGTEQDAQ